MIGADIFAVVLLAILVVISFLGIHFKIKKHPAAPICLFAAVSLFAALFLRSLIHLCVGEPETETMNPCMTMVYFVLFLAFAYFAKREIQEAR